ncbi:MAG TPA: hydantoinase/oxoprolinase family protein [Methylophilus sp.]|nr:hydantoinase/oxoprolinase family protein [Methylophilus sp.]HQQ33639.1 hydantoinase/oxoprolinase family protein [Methylophilus sp.]
MSKAEIVGWDIGGAHLKFALLNASGDLLAIEQRPCALWRGLDVLEYAIRDAVKNYHLQGSRHFATMTGELVDLFDSRSQGVLAIADSVSNILGPNTRFYAACNGWVAAAKTKGLERHIASANWHASASWLAQHIKDALLVDIGSTTTDIIAISNGSVQMDSVSDAERMRDDSLVYSGVVRTPVMALANKLSFEGVLVNVAAEYFATTADVYRLLGLLDPNYDMADTADGKGKSLTDSARRLARMLGHDLEDKSLNVWRDLANTCKQIQMQQIKTAVLGKLNPGTKIIGAGVGEFLVKAIAEGIGQVYEPVSASFPEYTDFGPCLPAYAVARLATQDA